LFNSEAFVAIEQSRRTMDKLNLLRLK